MNGKKMCIVTVENKEVESSDLADIVRIFEEPIQTAIDQIAEGVLPNLVRSGVMRELLDHLKKYLFHEFDKFVLEELDSVKQNNP